MTSEIDLRLQAADLKTMVAQYAGVTDDPELIDALANETDIKRCVVRVLNIADEAAAFADAITEIIRSYQERRKRYEAKSERLRNIVAQVMAETGLEKIVEPELTARVRPSKPDVVWTGEADASMHEFFPELVREKTSYDFDKTAVREALMAGERLPFASLGETHPVITVRRK